MTASISGFEKLKFGIFSRSCLAFSLPLIVDRRVLQLVLEEALVGVPAFRFGLVAEQREIQALDGLGAFLGQLRADALLFFQAGDFVAAGAAVEAHQRQAACSSAWDRP